jgi:pseudouridine synthase
VGLLSQAEGGGQVSGDDAIQDRRLGTPGTGTAAQGDGGFLAPAGRLDRGTSGLLLLTNDHDLADALLDLARHVTKTYRVKAATRLDDAQLAALGRGVLLDDGLARPAQTWRLRDMAKRTVLELRFTGGRNRQVRRMLAAVGSGVLELKCTAFGPLNWVTCRRGAGASWRRRRSRRCGPRWGLRPPERAPSTRDPRCRRPHMRARRSPTLATPLAVLLLCGVARADHAIGGLVGGAAGPINAVPAGTLPEGIWAASLRVEVTDLEQHSNAELLAAAATDKDLHSNDRIIVRSLSLAYGARDDVTLGAVLPQVVMTDLREAEAGEGIVDHGDVRGLGDLSLYGQWRLLDQPAGADSLGRLEVALLGGLKLPTGADREHGKTGELLETDHEPGSGSFDAFAGMAATRSWDRASLTADLVYTKAGQGSQQTNMGDVLRYDLAWSYRLSEELRRTELHPDGSRHVHGTADTQWDLVLELNGIWHEMIDFDGEKDGNTGGNRVLLAPGVRATTSDHVSVYASLGVPVLENVNGEEHKTDARVVAGVSWAF